MSEPSSFHILIAPQAFKGSLDAAGVAAAIAAGLRQGWSGLAPAIDQVALADGGEGTTQALVGAAGSRGMLIPVEVAGPLPGQRVVAELGWIAGEPPTAVVEMAMAAGLPLVPSEQRDPGQTTTRGVGELIRAALDRGAGTIYVGLGGSATNDGGAGMAQALGARLFDADGVELPPGGAELARLARIDPAGLDPRLQAVTISGITDVTNPLCGTTGASAIYGPQKGATPAQVNALDAALRHYAAILVRDLGRDVAEIPGAGAAGGLGAGLLAFGGPRTTLERGAEAVLRAVEIDQRLAWADLVITGEGQVDEQIAFGKITGTLATRAHMHGLPVWCVAGGLGAGHARAYELGVNAIIVAADGPRNLADAMAHAATLIAEAVARAVRLWQMPRKRNIL